jgi:hypothetical protein
LKEVIFYIKDHIRKDFNPWSYGITAVFLIVAFTINYTLDFEDVYLGSTYGKPTGYFYFSLYYAFAYYAIAFPKLLISGNQKVLKNREFWIKSSIFLALIGISGAYYYYDPVINYFSEANEIFFVKKIMVNTKRAFIYLIPLFAIKMIYDYREKGLYGFRFRNFNLRPYFTMLLIMIPLVAWASFQQDFLHTYPKLKPWGITEVFGLGSWQMQGIFEFFYGADFIFVEMIFRGALVVGLVKIMGKDAILPMVSAYAFLHFGKPLAEAVSSIFGGYILGVIALYSKNILGGCVIHMGVAYLMELFAILQYYLIRGN